MRGMLKQVHNWMMNKYYAVKWYLILNRPFRSPLKKLRTHVSWLEDMMFETVMGFSDDVLQLDINHGYLERRIDRLQGEVNDLDQIVAELKLEIQRLTQPSIQDLDELMKGAGASV